MTFRLHRSVRLLRLIWFGALLLLVSLLPENPLRMAAAAAVAGTAVHDLLRLRPCLRISGSRCIFRRGLLWVRYDAFSVTQAVGLQVWWAGPGLQDGWLLLPGRRVRLFPMTRPQLRQLETALHLDAAFL